MTSSSQPKASFRSHFFYIPYHILHLSASPQKGALQIATVADAPVTAAASQGHTSIVKLLLDAEANIEEGLGGRTPLELAALGGHLFTVELLLQRRAQIENRDGGAFTAIMLAIQYGHHAVVRMPTKFGADVNAISNDKSHRTPLMHAASFGHV